MDSDEFQETILIHDQNQKENTHTPKDDKKTRSSKLKSKRKKNCYLLQQLMSANC
jgi:hypothetical protein